MFLSHCCLSCEEIIKTISVHVISTRKHIFSKWGSPCLCIDRCIRSLLYFIQQRSVKSMRHTSRSTLMMWFYSYNQFWSVYIIFLQSHCTRWILCKFFWPLPSYPLPTQLSCCNFLFRWSLVVLMSIYKCGCVDKIRGKFTVLKICENNHHNAHI
jgi:hypothetical protein